MKKIYFFVALVLSTFFVQGQQNTTPTLSAGLDHVTFKQGTLNVELIAKIISEKQQELVREGIKRMIFEVIGTSHLDDYSQFYIERITEILFQEKNHKVMTKRILEESTNYLFVLGTTKLILESKKEEFKKLFTNNEEIDNIETTNLLNDTKPLILKDFNKKIGDIDISTRNQIIKTVLTICSEIPIITELGLLNDFNYYEHYKVYNKSFVKELIDDFNTLSKNKNVIKKLDEIFNDNEVSTHLSNIDLILKNTKKAISITSIPSKENQKILKDFRDNIKKSKDDIFKLEQNILKNRIDLNRVNQLIADNKELIKVFNRNDLKDKIETITSKNKEIIDNQNELKKVIKKDSTDLKKIEFNLKKKKEDFKYLRYVLKERETSSNDGNKLSIEITNLTKRINEIVGFESDISKKSLVKIIKKGLLSKENIVRYNKFIQIRDFIESLVLKSSVLKDILNQSGINFNKKETNSLQNILDDYKKNMNNYSDSILIFNDVKKGNKNSDFIDNITETITEAEKVKEEFEKKYNIQTINRITSEVSEKIKNQDFSLYQDINKLSETKTPESIINRFSLKKNLKGDSIKIVKKIITDDFLKDLTDLHDYLKIKKDSIKVTEYDFKSDDIKDLIEEKISAKKNSDDNIYKQYITSIETEKEYLDRIYDESELSEINKNYNKVRDYFKLIEILKNNWLKDIITIKEKEKNKNQYLNSRKISKENLIKIVIEKKDSLSLKTIIQKQVKQVHLDRVQNMINYLNLLKGKVIVNGYSKENDYSLFLMIKEYLVKFKFDFEDKLTDKENETLRKLTSFFMDRNLSKKLKTLDVINYFDNNFMAELLVLSSKLKRKENNIESESKEKIVDINKLIASIEFSISNLILQKTKDSEEHIDIPNLNKLTDFLKFIGNIKELNKAETFAFLLKTMNNYKYLFTNINDDKKLIPDLINSLREYAIIDLKNNLIEIDVASVLSHMLEKYQKDRDFSFYATVGLNQYWIPNYKSSNSNTSYGSFNAASEKIGVKYKIWNFNNNFLDEDKLIHKVKKKSLVSDIYAMGYVTGILYKIANTSGENYNYANIGVATGLSFFNSLDFNVSVSIPFAKKPFENYVVGFSFDIPLSEYLKRL